jgi:Starvation-inducible outer membrane lipoprotein
MKKAILYSFVVMLAMLSGCRKFPDTGEMDHEYIVRTNYDSSVSFGSFETYYIPDSVLLVTDQAKAQYWTDDNAMRLIDAVVTEMNDRGYTRSTVKADASLGIQLSYIESTYYFASYPGDYWWWGYPGYWGPGYWGGWGDWYYPYPIRYSYSTNSLLMDVIDLTSPQGRADSQLKVIWNAYITGFQSRSTQYNISRGVRAIEQAFTQSPYFIRNSSSNQ